MTPSVLLLSCPVAAVAPQEVIPPSAEACLGPPPRAIVAFSRAESATPNQVVSSLDEFESLSDSPASPTSEGEAGLTPPAPPVAVKLSSTPAMDTRNLVKPTPVRVPAVAAPSPSGAGRRRKASRPRTPGSTRGAGESGAAPCPSSTHVPSPAVAPLGTPPPRAVSWAPEVVPPAPARWSVTARPPESLSGVLRECARMLRRPTPRPGPGLSGLPPTVRGGADNRPTGTAGCEMRCDDPLRWEEPKAAARCQTPADLTGAAGADRAGPGIPAGAKGLLLQAPEGRAAATTNGVSCRA
eukprot:scaffold17460_cov128-Isochrysis_galbana.AAC.10